MTKVSPASPSMSPHTGPISRKKISPSPSRVPGAEGSGKFFKVLDPKRTRILCQPLCDPRRASVSLAIKRASSSSIPGSMARAICAIAALVFLRAPIRAAREKFVPVPSSSGVFINKRLRDSARPRVIGLRRGSIFVDSMVAGIDQQNSVRGVRHDSRRLARRNAYRVHAGELSTVEVRNFMLRQLQLANRAVVGISHQQIITVDRDSERMLQARVVEVSVDPTKVEESSADERDDLRIL